MAIIIEEERDVKTGIVAVVGWLMILSTIGLTVYYLFFKQPELIEVVIPGALQRTVAVSQIKLDSDRAYAVIKDPSFGARQAYIKPPGEGEVGRANPFQPL